MSSIASLPCSPCLIVCQVFMQWWEASVEAGSATWLKMDQGCNASSPSVLVCRAITSHLQPVYNLLEPVSCTPVLKSAQCCVCVCVCWLPVQVCVLSYKSHHMAHTCTDVLSWIKDYHAIHRLPWLSAYARHWQQSWDSYALLFCSCCFSARFLHGPPHALPQWDDSTW